MSVFTDHVVLFVIGFAFAAAVVSLIRLSVIHYRQLDRVYFLSDRVSSLQRRYDEVSKALCSRNQDAILYAKHFATLLNAASKYQQFSPGQKDELVSFLCQTLLTAEETKNKCQTHEALVAEQAEKIQDLEAKLSACTQQLATVRAQVFGVWSVFEKLRQILIVDLPDVTDVLPQVQLFRNTDIASPSLTSGILPVGFDFKREMQRLAEEREFVKKEEQKANEQMIQNEETTKE